MSVEPKKGRADEKKAHHRMAKRCPAKLKTCERAEEKTAGSLSLGLGNEGVPLCGDRGGGRFFIV